MHRVTKKYWYRIGGLGVVAAAVLTAIAMTGSCVFGSKTNLCEEFDLRCKEGQECAAEQPFCIPIGGCGNKHIDPGEACDDGNVMDGDGCSADCKSDEKCGNGTIDMHAK